MERGFLLLLGSIVALAIAAAAGAELDPGYQEGEHPLQQREPPRFQYLPREGGRRRVPGRKGRRLGSRNRAAAQGPAEGVPPPAAAPQPPLNALPPPALPQQFAGSFDGDSSAAPGEPGVDYPIYSHIPVTSFSCAGRIAGYYADPETQCQVFHVCTPGGSTSNSFICPNGTLFNPAVRTCDWWPAVDCGSSSESLRLNHIGNRVKDKTEATQSLLGGPGTSIKSQRTHNRQQNQQFTQKFTNEILSQDAHQKTDRQSIKFDREQQHSLGFTESIPTSPPQTTRRVEQYTQKNRQEHNTFVNSNQNTAIRRRPSGPKHLSNQSLKRNQYARTTTPPSFPVGQHTVAETYNPQPIATRAPAIRKFHWPPVSQTVTRFDITSETLDFPSFRNTPSSTTYHAPISPYTEAPTFPIIKSSTPFGNLALAPHRAPFSSQDTFPLLQISTTNSPYNEENKYRTANIVTQAPPISRPPLTIEPFNHIITQPQHLQATFAVSDEPSQQPLAPTPIQTTFEASTTVPTTAEITSGAEHYTGGPKTSEQPLRNSIFQNSPTYATYAESERSIRPIVVASPKPEVISFGSHKNVKTSPSGFIASQPILESFQPLTSEEFQTSQSNSAVKVSAPETRQGFPSSVTASVAQSFAESNAAKSGSAVEDPGTAQAFAQSVAFSSDLQYSDGEDFSPSFAGPVVTGSHGLLGFNEPQKREKEEDNLSPENTEFGNFQSTFAQSFASADTFVPDESFKETTPVSPTAPPTSPPKPTTFRPLNLVTVKTTSWPTTTTIKPVYTPTVPQTTARPTTPPAPISFTSTTTTARPITTVSATTNTVEISSTPHPGYSTINSFGASTTTKKPKGFYITVAPLPKPNTAQKPLQKDESPKENSLSHPSDTYLPNQKESTISPEFSPSLFYQPTRPSYIGVPNSYFRSPTNTQYSSLNTDYLSPEIKTPDAISDLGEVIDTVETPIKSTSFEIKIEPNNFSSSGFMLNPLATYEKVAQDSPEHQPKPKFNQMNETGPKISISNQSFQGTTEPPFVIQKSVELFAAHEVSFHPSVFSQTSYSQSSLQGDYSSTKAGQIDLQPPPYIQPSPNAKGFGNWNLDAGEEKRVLV